MSAIHPTAVIHPTAKVDPSAVIGSYALVGEETVVGPGCVVMANAVLEFVQMGAGNRIHHGACVGTAPQDLKYAGEKTRLVMGDKNVVRECVTLNRGTSATGETRIGSGCLFMAYSHVAHDCRIGDGVILANSVALAGHVEVGDYAVLGGLAAVHQFVRIGRLVMASGGTMIGKDILPFCTAQGDRATLRGLNSLGLRRAGLPPTTTRAIKDAYKTLFLSGLALEEAVAQIQGSNPPPEVAEVISFIRTAKRGITRPAVEVTEGEEVTI